MTVEKTYYVHLSARREVTRSVCVEVEEEFPRIVAHDDYFHPDGTLLSARGTKHDWPLWVLGEERGWHALPPGMVPPPAGHLVDESFAARPPAPSSRRVFAFIDQRRPGVVQNIVEERRAIEDEWHLGFREHFVDVTAVDPRPEPGWVLGEDGKFAPPPPPSRERQMDAALAAGLRVEGKFAATYDAVGPRWARMMEEVAYAREFGTFSGGQEHFAWSALEGNPIFEKPEDLRAVARAVADWVLRWRQYAEGKTDDPPPPSVEVLG